MTTVLNNQNGLITINYVGGKDSSIALYPGVNLNVSADEWEVIKKHPIAAKYLETGVLDVMNRKPAAKGELGGFQVTEDKLTDEPIPMVDINPSIEKTTRRSKTKKEEE
jgi:hypothetical protein